MRFPGQIVTFPKFTVMNDIDYEDFIGMEVFKSTTNPFRGWLAAGLHKRFPIS